MRPDRQRRGARHGREGRQGKPLKGSPRPSSGPPPCFCTLRALVRGSPPFQNFRAELEKVTLAIGKNPPASPRTCGGLPCPCLALPRTFRAGSSFCRNPIKLDSHAPHPPPLLFLLPECGQASPDRRRSGLPWSLIGGSVPDRRRSGLPWSLISCSGRPSARMFCRFPELCPAAAAYAPLT